MPVAPCDIIYTALCLVGFVMLCNVSSAHKAEPAEPVEARALLQARHKVETNFNSSHSIIAGFRPEQFKDAPELSEKNNCEVPRATSKLAHMPIPVMGLHELRGRARMDAERLLTQMMMAPHGNNKSMEVFKDLLELRAKELARVSEDPPLLALFNPSVVPLPESWRKNLSEHWLAAFRHMECSSSTGPWCLPRNCASIVVLAVLNEDYQLTRPARVLTHQDLVMQEFDCRYLSHANGYGPEDPRLLWQEERLLLFFNSKAGSDSPTEACPKESAIRMHAAQIQSDLTISRSFRIAMDSEIHGQKPHIGKKRMGVAEKNWSPFLYRAANGSEQVLLEYSINPHVVVDFNTAVGVAAKMVWNSSGHGSEGLLGKLADNGTCSHAHGGVGPLLVNSSVEGLHLEPPFYLSIAHAQCFRTHGDPFRFVYRSVFYAFAAEPPFQLLRMGRREIPLVKEPSIFTFFVAFPTHMQLVFDTDTGQMNGLGSHVVVFYGAGDTESRFLRLPLSKLSTYL
mmetsp:Transcript_42894/g.99928  ORF Transcript_42894/g.99928 Transcript_42894/m.99928 type:complete len:511 (+) Transcript_42894:73-1605(+)